MSPVFLAILLALAIAQIVLPQRLAFLPLLVAACHLGNIEVGAELTPCRLLIVLGLLRAAASGYLHWSFRNPLDASFGIFAFVAILVSFVPREDIANPFSQNIGLVVNVFGSYFYGKAFLQGEDILNRFSMALVCVLIPLAMGMATEQATGKNAYVVMGATNVAAMVREDRVRASGPFRHPILAGTAGAVSMPFMIYLWRRRRLAGMAGMAACGAIVVSSSSSGPLAAMVVSLAVLPLWFWRERVGVIQKLTLLALVLMHFSSSRGVWYLMARMDLVGGSTGYHRAKLIDNAMADISTWWIAGTDYTRNWMWSGVSWSDRHTDITNYYLHFGVIGGLGLLGSLLLILFFSFKTLGRGLKKCPQRRADGPDEYDYAFGIWCVGAAVFAHAVSFLSVSYFDQMYALFYLTIGMIVGLAPIQGTTIEGSGDDLEDENNDGNENSIPGSRWGDMEGAI